MKGHIYVCANCASKPGAYAGRARDEFIGKSVKLSFPIPNNPRFGFENMWVRVTALHGEKELEGELENEPVELTDVHLGDRVAFEVNEIADVLMDVEPTDAATPEEEKGADMIVLLQKHFSNVTEPKERALAGWRAMSDNEKKRVRALHEHIKPSLKTIEDSDAKVQQLREAGGLGGLPRVEGGTPLHGVIHHQDPPARAGLSLSEGSGPDDGRRVRPTASRVLSDGRRGRRANRPRSSKAGPAR